LKYSFTDIYFQMLKEARARSPTVSKATRGVIFLGTPHWNSGTTQWPQIIQRIIQNADPTGIPRSINSTEERELEMITAHFSGLGFKICTFIETDSVSCSYVQACPTFTYCNHRLLVRDMQG
jgi:hypothetical protein